MNNRIKNNTEVLIFNYIPEWGINQDITHFIRGKIINSEVSGYNFGNGTTLVNYTVLGEDNNKYYGNYNYHYVGNSFFLTEEDYIAFLQRKISFNKDEQQKLQQENQELEKIISSLKNNVVESSREELNNEANMNTDSDFDLPRLPKDKGLLKGLSHIDNILFLMKEVPNHPYYIDAIINAVAEDLEKTGYQDSIADYIKTCFLSETEEDYKSNVEELQNFISCNVDTDTYNYCMSIIDLNDEYFPKKDCKELKRIRGKIINN